MAQASGPYRGGPARKGIGLYGGNNSMCFCGACLVVMMLADETLGGYIANTGMDSPYYFSTLMAEFASSILKDEPHFYILALSRKEKYPP